MKYLLCITTFLFIASTSEAQIKFDNSSFWVYKNNSGNQKKKGGKMYTIQPNKDKKANPTLKNNVFKARVYMESKSVSGYTAIMRWRFYDKAGNKIYTVSSLPYGINGKYFFSTPKRRFNVNAPIPKNIVQKTAKITSRAIHSPTKRTRKMITKELVAIAIEILKSTGDDGNTSSNNSSIQVQ